VGDLGSFSPEYDDCRTVASQAGVALKTVLTEATAAYLAAKA